MTSSTHRVAARYPLEWPVGWKRTALPRAARYKLSLEQSLASTMRCSRGRGIAAGFAWRPCARKSLFYVDLGWSSGMVRGRDDCRHRGLDWEVRELGEGWLDKHIALERQGNARRYWLGGEP